jgi:hypothetical protein
MIWPDGIYFVCLAARHYGRKAAKGDVMHRSNGLTPQMPGATMV